MRGKSETMAYSVVRGAAIVRVATALSFSAQMVIMGVLPMLAGQFILSPTRPSQFVASRSGHPNPAAALDSISADECFRH
jgi:hypothetical protein